MSTSALPLPTNPPETDALPDRPLVSDPGDHKGKRPPVPEAWKNIAGYAAAVCLTLAILTATLRLWRADLTVPLWYSSDGIMSQMFVKNILETGWFLDNGRLGAPGAQDLRDFPMADVLHFAAIKLLGCFFHDSAIVLNLFNLLSFVLTALSSYFVLRRFNLGRLLALVAGVLTTCAPYHFVRMIGGHHFLAAYYLLPPMIWVILRVYLGRNPFLVADSAGDRPHWRFLSWEAAGAVLVCVLTGLAGVYYAFFSCFLLLTASIRAASRERCWAPLAATTLLILLIIGAAATAVSPSLLHFLRYGTNPAVAARLPAEADIFGLNISDMLLPVTGHRIGFLRHLRERFLAWPRSPINEASEASALGFLASLGFLYLIGRLLWRRQGTGERIDDGLAHLNLAAVLLGTIGGFGSCFAFYISPMIRCYNRISIFIAFFALAALFLALQRFVERRLKARWARAAFAGTLVVVLVLGVLDQTSDVFIPNYVATKSEYASDADFGRRMEATLPAGAMVYEMPYVGFPECPPVEKLNGYELLRPFLHTRTLRFSYGATKGRATGRWQAAVAARPLPEAIEQLAFAGFSGIYLDRAGFAGNGADAEEELSELLGTPPLVSLSGLQTFFDMREYVQTLRARFSDEEWAAKHEEALQPVDLR